MRKRRSFRGDSNAEFTEDSDVPGPDDSDAGSSAPVRAAPSATESKDKVAAHPFSMEKMKRHTLRSVAGFAMMGIFTLIIYLGPIYLCMMIIMFQCVVFSELVGVRKKMAAERRLPLFRSLQWAWFFVATFFIWSDSIYQYVHENPARLHAWSDGARAWLLHNSTLFSFGMYSAMFIISILTLRKGLYRYQITQYSWTLMTCCIIVVQMRCAFKMVYTGLFWFVLPASLVICNDIAAYFCGQFFGKKFISRKFLEISPNKTWEGFIGAAMLTACFAFVFSDFLSQYPSMICVPEDITFAVGPSTCRPGRMFLPVPFREMWRGGRMLNLAELYGPASLAPLGSWEVRPAQLHAIALGTFASFVAPFGGFLASAIKRAYGIKDFNSFIPGHGGMMDRFDCQFIMVLCTYVHHLTWCVKDQTFSVGALLAAVSSLSAEDRALFLQQLQDKFASGDF
mmetsp:Transcript_5614/g.16057  ORF Transcript_5614/g.16057 Transcript_5614/m.16057 type:complete len:453 (-) Transcript_5614:369-1727(-)